MDAARIICPECRRALNLPPQMEILREVKKGGGGFIAFGDPDRRLACPHCGHGIRTGDIIDGKHDPKPAGWLGTLAGLAVLGLIAFGALTLCSRR
jgi:hypothetical protein